MLRAADILGMLYPKYLFASASHSRSLGFSPPSKENSPAAHFAPAGGSAESLE
jgi:hypothetical protein